MILHELIKLPLVSAYVSILAFLATPLSPFTHWSMNLLSSSCSTVQGVTMKQVLPRLPGGVRRFIHVKMEAARHLMTRMDRLTCDHLRQLTERIPALRMRVPDLLLAGLDRLLGLVFKRKVSGMLDIPDTTEEDSSSRDRVEIIGKERAEEIHGTERNNSVNGRRMWGQFKR